MKSNYIKYVTLSVIVLGVVVGFQNCGSQGNDNVNKNSSKTRTPSNDALVDQPDDPIAGKTAIDRGDKSINVVEDDDLIMEVPAGVSAGLGVDAVAKWIFIDSNGMQSTLNGALSKVTMRDVALSSAGTYRYILEDSKYIVHFDFNIMVLPNTNKEFSSTLQWEPNVTPGAQFSRAVDSLVSTCAKAIMDIQAAEKPASFVGEGVVSSTAKTKSQTLANLWKDVLPKLGYCAHFADSALAIQAQDTLIAYLVAVSKVYKGGLDSDKSSDNDNPGNPINERQAIPFILAIDMVYSFMDATEKATVNSFLKGVDSRVAAFMGKLTSTDNRLKNAWMTQALVVRAYANLVLGDNTKILAVQKLMNAHVITSYTKPSGWKVKSCSNIKAVGVYGSFDFQERDSFMVHTRGIGEFMQLLTLKPTFLNSTAKAALTAALTVTKPYVLGTKTHSEYVCTTVQYDKDSAAAGISGYKGNWVPNNAREVFRFARIAISETKDWTSNFTKDDYTSWIKVLVSGRGDVIVYP